MFMLAETYAKSLGILLFYHLVLGVLCDPPPPPPPPQKKRKRKKEKKKRIRKTVYSLKI
jgi:hypothetical protein